MYGSAYGTVRIPECTPYAFYRVTLAQFEYRLLKAKCYLSYNTDDALFYRPRLTMDIRSLIESIWFTCLPVGKIIAGIGTVNYKGKVFYPRCLKDNVLGILYSNLKEIVTAMANPNTPPESRRAFYELNPLPFAKWNQPQRKRGDQPPLVDLDPLLLNPDDFMPPEYGDDDFANDVHCVQDFISFLNREAYLCTGRIPIQDYEAPGHQSILVSNYATGLRNPDKQFQNQWADEGMPQGDLDEFWAPENLSKEDFQMGIAILVGESRPDMAEALEAVEVRDPVSLAGPSSRDLDVEAEERRAEEQRKRARDPPVVYRDIDGVQEFEAFSKTLEGVELTAEEKQSLEELQQYLVQGEGSWVLGDEFLSFIGRILTDPSIKTSSRCGVLRCLAASALKDDVSLLLHQDRRQHALLGYAHSIDMLPIDEQRALGLFMCNLFENTSSSEWLLYISEWEYKGVALSNIRVTTKVCVQCMLSDQTDLREFGTALLYNIASKEVKTVVFDEVCVELAMAALQLTQYEPAEEHLWRTLTALARLAQHSSEVPQLIAIVGPDPSGYRGRSPRIDEQIDIIMKKVK
ncbi:unnamed protein product [Pieris macdunnoughi]|uniref:Uncharacterized protein n=2 Tax=Pieris macdunnoughi TaxID=345717 RepID=A0A821QMB8_9NEOP|nr:unnamed protein product [Pieris macdunnoughi]